MYICARMTNWKALALQCRKINYWKHLYPYTFLIPKLEIYIYIYIYLFIYLFSLVSIRMRQNFSNLIYENIMFYFYFLPATRGGGKGDERGQMSFLTSQKFILTSEEFSFEGQEESNAPSQLPKIYLNPERISLKS